jgi:integrase
MSVFKRGGVWWIEFVYGGKRIRESAKTSGKTIAIQAEKDKRLQLERALAGMPTEEPQKRIRTVSDAVTEYMKGYAVNHRHKSALRAKAAAEHIKANIGALLLPDLTQGRLTEYMKKRLAEAASNRTINIELATLSRALGSTWKALWPKLKKLEENKDVGRALEPEEEQRILDAAARNRSRLIYPYLMTLTWTGMRADEARLLTWGQVDFEAGEVIVGKAKTEAGTKRVIPMGQRLRAALEHHASWIAERLGSIEPGWFVFPSSCRIRPIDPTQPVTSLKVAWESVRTKASVAAVLAYPG